MTFKEFNKLRTWISEKKNPAEGYLYFDKNSKSAYIAGKFQQVLAMEIRADTNTLKFRVVFHDKEKSTNMSRTYSVPYEQILKVRIYGYNW